MILFLDKIPRKFLIIIISSSFAINDIIIRPITDNYLVLRDQLKTYKFK